MQVLQNKEASLHNYLNQVKYLSDFIHHLSINIFCNNLKSRFPCLKYAVLLEYLASKVLTHAEKLSMQILSGSITQCALI